MKSIFLAVALLIAALTTETFATDVKVAPSTLVSFRVKFTDATDVQWTSVDHLYRADFTVNGEKTVAYFSKMDGALVVTCKFLTITDLPRDLQSSLKQQMTAATLTELYVVKSDDAVDYYATIKKGEESIILKSASSKWVRHTKG